LSTTNPTWPDLGSNPGRRGGKPLTNRLSYGTAIRLWPNRDNIRALAWRAWWKLRRSLVRIANVSVEIQTYQLLNTSQVYIR
jgi:hypothetical protein